MTRRSEPHLVRECSKVATRVQDGRNAQAGRKRAEQFDQGNEVPLNRALFSCGVFLIP